MKKNIILPAIIVLIIIACTIFISDGLTYLITSLMALAILVTIQRNRSGVMKITRWAKANPLKAQVLITVLQIVIMALGLIAGYNFKKLGYELSDTSAFVFSTIIILGFLSVHFLPKRGTIAIPKEVNKDRLVYISIALSSFVMMVLTGNRIEDKFPNSSITHALAAIDQAIFPESSTSYDEPDNVGLEQINPDKYKLALTNETTPMVVFASFNLNENESITPPSTYSKKEAREKLKAEKKAKRLENKKARMMNRLEKYRLAFAGGLSAGAIILIILLIGTLCAGICLIIGGFSGGSAGLIPLGAVIAGGSIWGLIKIFKDGGAPKKLKEK